MKKGDYVFIKCLNRKFKITGCAALLNGKTKVCVEIGVSQLRTSLGETIGWLGDERPDYYREKYNIKVNLYYWWFGEEEVTLVSSGVRKIDV